MNVFKPESDGLDRLREATSSLKRWRPPKRRKLQAALELVVRSAAPFRQPKGAEPSEGKLRDLAAARVEAREAAGVVRDAVTPRPYSHPGSNLEAAALAGSPPVGAPSAPYPWIRRRRDNRLRKLEHLFPQLRWLFRRLERWSIAVTPFMLRARRVLANHRVKSIWIFVLGACLLVSSS